MASVASGESVRDEAFMAIIFDEEMGVGVRGIARYLSEFDEATWNLSGEQHHPAPGLARTFRRVWNLHIKSITAKKHYI